uniref:RING-type domain-containing protein n=1 Tax=Electrophorus electricus TaxID=8005 RepID=A0AAY5F629_ELEEL
MAEARVSVNLDQFSCPICLELLKDPVSIPCGHSFCMTCIKTKWDQDDQTGDYSCPLCRKTSTLRPDLGRNTVLAEMVEKLKNAHIAYRTLAGPEDVSCDNTIRQKKKNLKNGYILQFILSYV